MLIEAEMIKGVVVQTKKEVNFKHVLDKAVFLIKFIDIFFNPRAHL